MAVDPRPFPLRRPLSQGHTDRSCGLPGCGGDSSHRLDRGQTGIRHVGAMRRHVQPYGDRGGPVRSAGVSGRRAAAQFQRMGSECASSL
ncbi:hypothetical protein G6F50_018635 [Rhizopus delemar]|uniref:Uncharacterized protein n=1 Tax=Rhizopus delemar TaxID=936053 RepID=A0A9P7BYE8_9FUNG|nr:hypothetical protein G6F50_018635 [Rhizopus delemar]